MVGAFLTERGMEFQMKTDDQVIINVRCRKSVGWENVIGNKQMSNWVDNFNLEMTLNDCLL